MNLDQSIYQLNQWVCFVIFFGALLAAAELGTQLGFRQAKQGRTEKHPLIGTASSAALGVLGLLLGFSFSMAVNRFDTRRQMVLQESNDIGTAYLRTRLLPKPQSETAAALLRQYVDNRVALFSHRDLEARPGLLQKAGQLQDSLWAEAVNAAKENPPSVYTSLFIQALNSVIDTHSARLDADRNHLPRITILLLLFVAFICLAMLGYLSSLEGTRSFLSTTALSLVFSLVVVVILDLDRPTRGLIRVDQFPMIELQKSVNAGSAR